MNAFEKGLEKSRWRTYLVLVNIVPVFWKSPDELSKRLSLPVCWRESEKQKDGKERQNTISYEIAFHRVKKTNMQYNIREGFPSFIERSKQLSCNAFY